jgi:regulator of protease activity HflC (stomatin/prohibitin superfamily)
MAAWFCSICSEFILLSDSNNTILFAALIILHITSAKHQNIVVNPVLAKAMHAQSGAERQKRARIIESEGERLSIQNLSEGLLPP